MIEAIFEERCNGCEICVLVCPKNIIEFDRDKGKPYIVNREKCTVCYKCNTSCSLEAIIVTDYYPASQSIDSVGERTLLFTFEVYLT